MDPNLFLENGDDSQTLLGALAKAAARDSTPADRQAALSNAGVSLPMLQLNSDAVNYALQLAAAFRRFCVSERRPDYHPMLKFVEHLVHMDEVFQTYNFDDEETALFGKLLGRGRENMKALEVLRAVGKIEDAQGQGIGTGTHIGGGRLLTCDHVFTKTGATAAWVRFGYKPRCGSIQAAAGTRFELDLANPAASSDSPDFAVLQIKGEVSFPALKPAPGPVSSGEAVRLIHHPGGLPVEVSDVGSVRQVGRDYIDHDVPTRAGSSGAPIFNRNWELVALHRGRPGVGRESPQGTTEGLPVRAIWEQIKSFV